MISKQRLNHPQCFLKSEKSKPCTRSTEPERLKNGSEGCKFYIYVADSDVIPVEPLIHTSCLHPQHPPLRCPLPPQSLIFLLIIQLKQFFQIYKIRRSPDGFMIATLHSRFWVFSLINDSVTVVGQGIPVSWNSLLFCFSWHWSHLCDVSNSPGRVFFTDSSVCVPQDIVLSTFLFFLPLFLIHSNNSKHCVSEILIKSVDRSSEHPSPLTTSRHTCPQECPIHSSNPAEVFIQQYRQTSLCQALCWILGVQGENQTQSHFPITGSSAKKYKPATSKHHKNRHEQGSSEHWGVQPTQIWKAGRLPGRSRMEVEFWNVSRSQWEEEGQEELNVVTIN